LIDVLQRKIMAMLTHFARTLRPKKLSQVIGQDSIVSMLSNSIFLGRYFPVYLFYGQRGCGKTTVARILATMINCQNLENFKKNPKDTQLPCTECASCIASRQGSHPDFIEIDAASNTGVDNVRAILESAQYLPLMGQKKIYLIDEAHMLSKAAFNALLKMLEEPPASALFILATTEVAKIPITVKSRSFLGVFNAPSHQVVSQYIATVALDHNINITETAIKLLVSKADRCIRDALNLLEQLSSLHAEITLDVITHTFGIADTKAIIAIINAIITHDAQLLFTELENSSFSEKNPTTFWQNLCEGFISLTRAALGAPALNSFVQHESELALIAKKTTKEKLSAISSHFWNAEKIINATTNKHLFIEHFLYSLCSETLTQPPQNSLPHSTTSSKNNVSTAQKSDPEPRKTSAITHSVKPMQKNQPAEKVVETITIEKPAHESPQAWGVFLESLSTQHDKIPFSILRNAQVHLSGTTLIIEIEKFNSFLEEQLSERAAIWKKQLLATISGATSIQLKATPKKKAPESATETKKAENPAQPTLSARNLAQGPTTDLIMKYFPGKLI